MLWSLAMTVERLDTGEYEIGAPWLSEPVRAASFYEAYWLALAKRVEGRPEIGIGS